MGRKVKPVSYLRLPEIHAVAEAAKSLRYGERNHLLVRLLFQTGLRISEALSLTPSDLVQVDGVYAARVKGKGRKERWVHIPPALYSELRDYILFHSIQPHQKIFKVHRTNAWRMLQKAARQAGLFKRVFPHILRHSHAIEVLRQTRNPRVVQLHLGHSSATTTMRYLITLEQEEALRAMREVRFE